MDQVECGDMLCGNRYTLMCHELCLKNEAVLRRLDEQNDLEEMTSIIKAEEKEDHKS